MSDNIEGYVSRCDDGLTHCFRRLDDGVPSLTPLCGRRGTRVELPADDDELCEKCLPHFENLMGLVPGSLDGISYLGDVPGEYSE